MRRSLFALLALAPLTVVGCGGRSNAVDDADAAAKTAPPCAPGSNGCPAIDGDAAAPPDLWPDAGNGAPPGSGPEPYPDGSVPPASSSIAVLDYEVIDAAYSAPLGLLVLASGTPSNALHLRDTATGAERVIALPAVPVAVALDPSGTHAAVAFDAHLARVDLASAKLTDTCAVSSDAYDVALASNGTAYVMPRTDQWVSIHAVDSTCAETLIGGLVYAESRLALHPSEKALFTADQGLSPSSVNQCNLAASTVNCSDALSSEAWGTYGFCGELWISADGQRIYTGCGVTLRVPAAVGTALCTYGGTLADVSSIQHLGESPAASRVALIPGVGYYTPPGSTETADTVVRIHETDYLGFVKQLEIPAFPLNGGATAIAHGRFVFPTPTMDRIYVVVKADPSSGALHDEGIVTLTP